MIANKSNADRGEIPARRGEGRFDALDERVAGLEKRIEDLERTIRLMGPARARERTMLKQVLLEGVKDELADILAELKASNQLESGRSESVDLGASKRDAAGGPGVGSGAGRGVMVGRGGRAASGDGAEKGRGTGREDGAGRGGQAARGDGRNKDAAPAGMAGRAVGA